MATEYDFNLYQGESLNATLRLRDNDGYPVNMYGYTVSGYIISSYCCTGVYYNLPLTILSPVESGYINCYISGEITRNFPVGKLPYHIKRYGGSGIIEPVLFGDFNIDPA